MCATGATAPPNFDLRRHAEVDSTNRVATDLARQGAPDGVVVVADHQTAGRGRFGHTWEAPPGSSLLVSVLLRPAVEPEALQLMTVAGGVAAAEACLEVTGIKALLKWPNDLVSDDLKLAGILSEFVPPVFPAPVGRSGPGAVVVGLGLNSNWHQPLPEGATALNLLTGEGTDREALLQSFLPKLRAGACALGDRASREELLDRYRRLCSTLGRTVAVRLGGREVTARAVGIDAHGYLIVEREGHTRRISAGSVTHLAED